VAWLALPVGGVTYRVVTTMNAQGWNETGGRMVESFNRHWPDALKPLVIYAENFHPNLPAEVRRLPEWVGEFKQRFALPIYRGIRRGIYDYRYDAVKFVHKVGAITDFGLSMNEGVMIWLDADTFTHADVTTDWLDNLFPEPGYIAWLDRANNHPECGFVMYRCSHPYHPKFMEEFRRLYISGDVFQLRESHDSFVLHHLVTSRLGKIPLPVSLSGDARNWHHPFVSGPLGAKLDHMKGPRKSEGRSRLRDLRRPRTEAYWRG
jgi:hypothetical protein